MKRINASGLWAIVVLTMLFMSSGLFFYVDHRFGPETSAFLLGAVLGVPLLLIVVAIVGAIYIMVIRGTVHLQERDDVGEIERMRTLRELVRNERIVSQKERVQLDAHLKQVKLLDKWQQKSGNGQANENDWPIEENNQGWNENDDDSRDASYQILE